MLSASSISDASQRQLQAFVPEIDKYVQTLNILFPENCNSYCFDWIRTQRRAAEASRRTTKLATHLSKIQNEYISKRVANNHQPAKKQTKKLLRTRRMFQNTSINQICKNILPAIAFRVLTPLLHTHAMKTVHEWQ